MKRFCIPPEHNAAFVQSMQDVLDVFHLPYDPQRPVACFDETSKQLVPHTRALLPVPPAMAECVDDEYKRCGTANLFLAVEPLTGEVILQPTPRRTAVDGAEFLRCVADEACPQAAKIVLVSDNLDTHTPVSFYEAFAPEQARRRSLRFEIHHTPKHGSWLSIVPSRQTKLSIRNPQLGFDPVLSAA